MKTKIKKLSELDFYFDEIKFLYLFPAFVFYKQKWGSSKRLDLKIFFTEEDAVDYFDNQIKNEIGTTYMVDRLKIDLAIVLEDLNLKTNLNKKNIQQEISIEQLNSIELLNPFGNWSDDMPYLYEYDYYCHLCEKLVLNNSKIIN
jgi:hypothetical protein